MAQKTRFCPALFISAPASGQGKTTVAAALARFYRNRGLNVRVFKTGPDFIDPMILAQASGNPVYQLDLWMGGEDHCRQLLYHAAGDADLILIEGMMGLFDGESSSADLAQLFNIPVLAVIDGSAMAQTFAAIAYGLATYRPDLAFAGVFANRLAGESHFQMLAESFPSDIKTLGWLPREAELSLPERHLGLVQASELNDLETRLENTAAALKDIEYNLPAKVRFYSDTVLATPTLLKGVRIAVAQDAAFSFIYRANLELLESLGSELRFFSPLTDSQLPEADAMYLPGGYPELYLDLLAANTGMKQALQRFHQQGHPMVAECGGMLYLLESLTDANGYQCGMAGLIPGHASVGQRLANLGLHTTELPEGTLRGHTFHFSEMTTSCEPIVYSSAARDHGRKEPVYQHKRLTASYLHWYFPSSPETTAKLFSPCQTDK